MKKTFEKMESVLWKKGRGGVCSNGLVGQGQEIDRPESLEGFKKGQR